MLTDTNNPYVPKAHRASLRSKRIPLPKVEDCNFPPTQEYENSVGVDSELGRDIAKTCGVRLVDSPDRYGNEYNIKVPIPPVYPYHPLENPHGTRMPQEEAVKNYDNYWSGRLKREKNRN